MLYDLGLNLLAELIGIVVTILFIDRLLKKRERKKWLSVINIIRTNLLREATRILAILTPSRTIEKKRKTGWGDEYSLPEINFENLDRLLANKSLYKFIEEELKSNRYNMNILDELKHIEQRLANITIQSISVLEPEVMQMILDLRRAIEEMYPFYIQPDLDENEQSREFKIHYMVNSLVAVIQNANTLRKWMENPT